MPSINFYTPINALHNLCSFYLELCMTEILIEESFAFNLQFRLSGGEKFHLQVIVSK